MPDNKCLTYNAVSRKLLVDVSRDRKRRENIYSEKEKT
jgi:hypothetical protein